MLEELNHLMGQLHNQRDVSDHRLFALFTDLTEHSVAWSQLWLERVFRLTPEVQDADPVGTHSLNVSVISLRLAGELGLRGKDLLLVGVAALLHDVGMLGLPSDMLRQDGPLSDDQRRLMKTHPDRGSLILRDSGLSRVFARVALQEHERADGSGYPQGLRSDQIDLTAQVVGVCDTLESLTHARPWRRAVSFFEGISHLLRSGRDQFSRRLWVAAFRSLTPYPPGSLVRLSSGRMARVKDVRPETPMRPLVEVLDGDPAEVEHRLVDLQRHPMITIREALV